MSIDKPRETRRLTMISLTVVLDREMTRDEFEQICIPEIKKVCSFHGDKYAPEAWVDRHEYREMGVIPPGCPHMPLEGEVAPVTPPEGDENIVGEPDAVGEGLAMDLTRLKENLKYINWTEDTAKTWLTSQFQIDPRGSFTEVLQRLTREQAEKFVKEIQDRVAKRQTELFD